MPYISDPRGLYHVFYQCNLNSTLPPWAPGQEGTRSFTAPLNIKYELACACLYNRIVHQLPVTTYIAAYLM